MCGNFLILSYTKKASLSNESNSILISTFRKLISKSVLSKGFPPLTSLFSRKKEKNICYMVSDSDFIFCTMQNEGYGETSPSSDFVCTLYIQNLCLRLSHSCHFTSACVSLTLAILLPLGYLYVLMTIKYGSTMDNGFGFNCIA